MTPAAWGPLRVKREAEHRRDARACFERDRKRRAALVKPSRAAMQRARARAYGQHNAQFPMRNKVRLRKGVGMFGQVAP